MTTTTNKNLTLPVIGGSTNSWGSLLNGDLALIDSAFGGAASISVAGSSNVTLNSTQASNLIQSLTGLLTGNISVLVPQTGSFYIVVNGSTGAFTITVKTTAGGSTGVIVPQGSTWLLYSNGTNVTAANWNDGTQFYGQDTGTASALTATLNIAVAAYFNGFTCTVRVANVNSANATLNVNSIGALPIYVASGGTMVAIGAGVFAVGQDVSFIFDQALNSGGGGWQAQTQVALSNVAFTNVANTFTAAQTIEVSTATPILLQEDDSGATAGPLLEAYRNSTSAAPADFIGGFKATGQNSTPTKVTYGSIVGEILDPTASSEDFAWLLNGKVAGADTALATLGPGLQLGAPTGGDKGVGTLNATGVYVNGAALSLSGATIQTVPQVSTTYQTCSTPIPDDDTPPLAAEGDLVLSVSFTPKLSTSTIVISVVVPVFNSTTVNACVSLCSSANSGNAVAAVQFGSNTATFPKTVSLLHTEAASSTAARTYSIRCGPASGSVYINGNASTRKLGGVEGAIMIIQEISA